jgi:hypothetical protein
LIIRISKRDDEEDDTRVDERTVVERYGTRFLRCIDGRIGRRNALL